MILNILGHQVPVILNDHDKVENGLVYMGYYDSLEQEIHLFPNSDSQQASTLLHEIIEAVNSTLELHLKHPQISSLENALYQILTSNPQLLGVLSGKQKLRTVAKGTKRKR